MKQTYTEEKTFTQIDFQKSPIQKGEYENCSFVNCDFSDADLSEVAFVSCNFISCNLSLVKLTKTAFRDCKFNECKMLGIQFNDCNPFGFSAGFSHCNLSHASFFKTKLKNMSCPLNHWVAEADEPVNTGSSGDNNGNQFRSPTK